MHDFRAPRWLPGGHAQTIWPVFFSRRFVGPRPHFRRERWRTPDGDFVDVDWHGEDAAAPLLVLFHGLEGSSRSHYAEAFAADAARRGWRYAVPHFRGCSGEINAAPRAYHSGDHEEIGAMLAAIHLRESRWSRSSRSRAGSSSATTTRRPRSGPKLTSRGSCGREGSQRRSLKRRSRRETRFTFLPSLQGFSGCRRARRGV